MVRLKKRKHDEGFLSALDAIFFAIILLLVSLTIFQISSTTQNQEMEMRSNEIKREYAEDIHEVVLDSTISQTSYFNESSSEVFKHENITVESALKLYLYLDDLEEEHEDLNYELSSIREDIDEKYERGAWEVSRFRYAVRARYEGSEFFISSETNMTSEDDLPHTKTAYSTHTTLRFEKINITLFIWR